MGGNTVSSNSENGLEECFEKNFYKPVPAEKSFYGFFFDNNETYMY